MSPIGPMTVKYMAQCPNRLKGGQGADVVEPSSNDRVERPAEEASRALAAHAQQVRGQSRVALYPSRSAPTRS
jgi:hypothetical protein